MMSSLRLMLTVIMLFGIGLSVGLSSWMSTRDASHQIEELFDAQMLQTAKILELFYHYEITPADALSLVQQPLVLHIEESSVETFSQKSDALKLAYENRLAFQIWSNKGEALIFSDNTNQQALTDFVQGYHQRVVGQSLWHVFSYFSWRDNVWIVTAQRDEVRAELVSEIMGNAFSAPLMVVPIVLMVMLLFSYWAFKPLKALEQHLKQRSPKDITPIAMALPSELKPIQTALNSYINRFANALARERRFSADAAHELKTPLTVIKLHQDGLRELLGSSSQSQLHLDAIDNGVYRLSHTVEQLLLLARIDSVEELSSAQCDVQSLVENSLNQLMPRITEFEWDIAIAPDLILWGDHFYLELVLKNILENACKYSPAESLIRIEAYDESEWVTLKVIDNGFGMSEEQILSAKDRFYRVNENQGYGAGLGLSICQHIVDLHHGQLRLHPNPQGGLIVSVQLPAFRQQS